MTAEKSKNEAAAALGRLGGQARAQNLSGEQRQEIARAGGLAKWQRNRDRPEVHDVVKQMIATIESTKKKHTMYSVNGFARFCETGSTFDDLWGRDPSTCVGTYDAGTQFTDVLNDVLAT